MANSTTHASLPYPIRKARFSLALSFRVSAGTPTDPTTPDTEFSTDGGATFGDCAEEITTGGVNGMGYLTLSGAETDNPLLLVAAKSANCVTTPAVLYPRNLPILSSGTLSAGSAGGGTLGTLLAYDVTGCFVRTTGGTGGGGTGGANNQARRIITYTVSTGAFTVSPNWETTPSTDTTYDVLCPEGVTPGVLKTLNPTTPGRTLVVDSVGLADANTVKVGPTGSGTAQTARDIGAAVPAAAPGAANGLLIAGSNAATTFAGLTTGALACTTITASGAVAFQSTFAVTTSTSLGALSCTTLTASGAVAFQSTFAVTTSTSLAALSCSTLTASGAVAFQSTFATTGTTTFNALTVTNAMTVSGTTTLTGAVSLGSTLGVTGATTFTGVVTMTNGLTANITGNLIGTVSTLTTYTGNTPQTGDTYALANGASGFVAIAGYIDTEIATLITSVGAGLNAAVLAVKAKTDSLTFTVGGQVDANCQYVNDVQVIGTGASGTEWGPAP